MTADQDRSQRWLKVAVLACVLCAAGWANADGPQPEDAQANASAGGSCFFTPRGVQRWCLGPKAREANSWEPCGVSIVYRDGDRYFVSEGNLEQGYVRPAGPGRWRAMVPVYRGWARDGMIVRAPGRKWVISSRGRTLGFARGSYPVAVGAYRLLAGDC